MTEQEAIERIRAFCEPKIGACEVTALEREPVEEEGAFGAALVYDLSVAVIVRDGGFDGAFVAETMAFCQENDWLFRFGGTRKEVHDLDFEVMIVRAMVSP